MSTIVRGTRLLTETEKGLIRFLLSPDETHYFKQVEGARVSEYLSDGLILQFENSGAKLGDRSGLRTFVEAVGVDESGQPELFVLLFVDAAGNIAELEVYRSDGEEISQLPSVERLKLV